MSAVFTAWLQLSTSDKIINLGLFVVALALLGKFLIGAFKTLRIQRISVPALGDISIDEKETTTPVDPPESAISFLMEDLKNVQQERDELRKNLQLLQSCVDKMELENEIRRNDLTPLQQHIFFFRLRQFMERGIDISFVPHKKWSEEKKVINETFLVDCHIKIFYEGVREWVADIEKENNNPTVAMTKVYKIVDLIYSLIDKYNKEASHIEIKLPSGKTLIGVPRTYLTKFDDWHEPHIKATLMKIQSILHSDFYRTWQLKLILILDQLDTTFLHTIMDAERTLNELNGELEREIETRINASL